MVVRATNVKLDIGEITVINRVIWLILRQFGYVAVLCVLTSCVQTAAVTQTVNSVSAGSSDVPMVKAINLSNQRLQQVPVTFGQPFRAGAVPRGHTIVAYADGKELPTQANIKARNPDGSARHAILTVLLPTLDSRASENVSLRSVPDTAVARSKALTIEDVLHTKFDADVQFQIGGEPWHLDARVLLQRALRDGSCKPYGRECNQWLSGPLVSEWVVGGPLLDEQGKPHPHLAVYFAVRAYGPVPVSRVRVDVIVENDWAYAPDPHNERYDGTIKIGDQTVAAVKDLEHYRQARWHKTFRWGAPDPVYAELSSHYLQYSRAVPRYEDVYPSEAVLRRVRQTCAPMQNCDQTRYMANTGAQDAIGPLARWSSVYVIDPTYRAYRWMLANDDALGAYGIHYRDQLSGQPVSVEAHPCMTLYGPAEVARCPVPPYKNDIFPRCKNQCKTPLYPDEAHHPEPAYVAYLVTGDWYYLEELKFWADWVVFHQNPAYRDYTKGLIEDTQLRGQAWALRTLGYAAYILPENDPLKSYFKRVVENNIQWYNQNYTDNPRANALHIIINGYATDYTFRGKPHTGMSTWQQSYFNWAVGNLADLGFPGADRLRNWFAVFQINLMTSPDFCWTMATTYILQVRDSAKGPLYDSLHRVYARTFPQFDHVACNSRGVMVGHPKSPTGYPASFQVGLAAAADSNLPEARKAWAKFAQRLVKPDYANAPQFAIIPRHRSD